MLGSLRLLLGVSFLSFVVGVGAAELEVLRVDFDLVEEVGAKDPWYEVGIVLSVERGDVGSSANPRFADDIVVSLALATEVERKRGTEHRFYASRVEYPTLEVGQHTVRFYLPPELVKRDRVKGEPFAFEIEVISRDRHEVSLVSRNLESRGSLQSFHSRIEAAGSAVGYLRPQYRTPFAGSYPRSTPNPRIVCD